MPRKPVYVTKSELKEELDQFRKNIKEILKVMKESISKNKATKIVKRRKRDPKTKELQSE